MILNSLSDLGFKSELNGIKNNESKLNFTSNNSKTPEQIVNFQNAMCNLPLN